MTLENKIANWVELGVMPYSETMILQDRLVNLRNQNLIPDTILSVQHPLTVSFGADKKNNQFSDLLLFAVNEQYGNTNHDSIIDYLSRQKAVFVESNRGGGATVFAPGQFLFYPVVDHREVTGSDKLDLTKYKDLIYRSLFETLRSLGVGGINVGSQQSFDTRAERRDAWIFRDGVTYKMGSKGLGIKGNVAYNGFAVNAYAEGISRSWMVNQCGYKPDETRLWSVEQELGRKVSPQDIYDSAQKAIANNFGYSGFNIVKLPQDILGVPA